MTAIGNRGFKVLRSLQMPRRTRNFRTIAFSTNRVTTERYVFRGTKSSLESLFMQFPFFHGSLSSAQVYEDTVVPLLSSFLEGYNCSVFAYGATGSGKDLNEWN